MPRSAVKSTIGIPFTELSTINSTNIYAMDKLQANLAAHGAAFFAWEQTEGKGQMGKQWLTKKGENCLLSVILDTSFLMIGQQFQVSVAVALACYDCLSPYITNDLSIKWPNDIYWRDRKTGGILIENNLSGNNWQWSVAGVGLNINQTEFSEMLHKAVSLKQITGQNHDPLKIAKEFCVCLNARYDSLKNGDFADLLNEFNNKLYKRGELVSIKKNNILSTYLIKSVTDNGELVAEAGIEHHFLHGSVEWIG